MPGAGDKSFEKVALPHLEVLYRVAQRLARDAHVAEDLVQETYLKAHKAFGSFELREFGIRPWLLRILHNTYLNEIAKQRRVPRSVEQQNLDQLHERPSDMGDLSGTGRLDFEQIDEQVKAAVDRLRPEYRTVVLLWATMELSYQEIAETLEVPIGTVMSRLHRARRQLVESLQDYAADKRIGTPQKTTK